MNKGNKIFFWNYFSGLNMLGSLYEDDDMMPEQCGGRLIFVHNITSLNCTFSLIATESNARFPA